MKLEHFSAGSNRFSGPLPASLVNSPSLSLLELGNNYLACPISVNCSSMIHITYLDPHKKFFDGPIPEQLSRHGLSFLNLGRYNVGELPSSFGNLKALKLLLLQNVSLVNFSAALETLQHCKNLTTLILNQNFRNEEIPQRPDMQFKMLKTFTIANSQLRGSLPMWLRGCTKLQLLHLSMNQLSRPIPIWIGKLNHLFYLDLSHNFLTEDMPESSGNLGNFTNLDFSMVDPFSSFPVYLRTPGRQSLSYSRMWSLPSTVDSSNNKLTGPIIPDLGNLKWLHVLKLSNNSFSGNIPDALSGMKNLESMDLSLNNLLGEIPRSLIILTLMSPTMNSMVKFPQEVSSFSSSSFWGTVNCAVSRLHRAFQYQVNPAGSIMPSLLQKKEL